MLKTIKADYQIILFLGLVAVYHVILQDRGAYSWPDEHLYNDALKSIAALLQLDFPLFCKSLTGFGARPAEATLRLVPAAIQTLLERWQGISPYNPESLRIAASFNIISSFLLSFAFYRLSQLFYDNDKLAAILATGIYALLVSNNVFVRHIIPYDTAMMFCLLALYLVLKAKMIEETNFEVRKIIFAIGLAGVGLAFYPLSFLISRQVAMLGAIFALLSIVGSIFIATGKLGRINVQPWIIAGVVAGFGLAVYPAYYSFPCALLLVILLRKNSAPYIGISRSTLYAGALFSLSLLAVVFFWEVIARIGNESYLGCAYRLSKTITQGEFSEGYVFLAKYFVEVEGPIGTLLLTLSLIWLGFILVRLIRGSLASDGQQSLAICCAIWFCLYFIYATQSTILHKMNFHGRYARVYFPFVVWPAIELLRQMQASHMKKAVYFAISTIALYSFCGYAMDYKRLAYPVNVLNEIGMRLEDIPEKNKVYEAELVKSAWIATIPSKGIFSQADYITHHEGHRFILLNFGFFNVINGKPLEHYTPPRDAQIVYTSPHFLTFSASLFEGPGSKWREVLKTKGYQVAIYKLPSEP